MTHTRIAIRLIIHNQTGYESAAISRFPSVAHCLAPHVQVRSIQRRYRRETLLYPLYSWTGVVVFVLQEEKSSQSDSQERTKTLWADGCFNVTVD
jgi:hypothetical protein